MDADKKTLKRPKWMEYIKVVSILRQ